MRVSITERIPRHEHSILDGAFYGWADPRSEDPESGEFPFVFDLPDYDLHNSLQLPVAANVQIAAFAHHLNGFANEEAYLASQREGRKFAPESFIPSGLFTPDGKVTEPPQAYSIFSGHVLDTAVINNPATNHEFYWAKVRTLGGEIDVVADPQIVKGSIVKDGIVRGTFWLSGRLA